MEHLPRASAVYKVTPLDYPEAAAWLEKGEFASAVRTTEMIDAIQSAMNVTLTQSAMPVSLEPGDEALMITLSFGVLLAWAEERMAPLPEDWRCILLNVQARGNVSAFSGVAAIEDANQLERIDVGVKRT